MLLIKLNILLNNVIQLVQNIGGRPLDIIQGFSVRGVKITLLNSFNTYSTINTPGISTATYVSNGILLNVWIESLDEIMIKSAKIQFTDIDKWVGIHGFQMDFNSDEKKVNVEYKLPNEIKVSEINNLNLSFEFDTNRINVIMTYKKML